MIKSQLYKHIVEVLELVLIPLINLHFKCRSRWGVLLVLIQSHHTFQTNASSYHDILGCKIIVESRR